MKSAITIALRLQLGTVLAVGVAAVPELAPIRVYDDGGINGVINSWCGVVETGPDRGVSEIILANLKILII